MGDHSEPNDEDVRPHEEDEIIVDEHLGSVNHTRAHLTAHALLDYATLLFGPIYDGESSQNEMLEPPASVGTMVYTMAMLVGIILGNMAALTCKDGEGFHAMKYLGVFIERMSKSYMGCFDVAMNRPEHDTEDDNDGGE